MTASSFFAITVTCYPTEPALKCSCSGLQFGVSVQGHPQLVSGSALLKTVVGVSEVGAWSGEKNKSLTQSSKRKLRPRIRTNSFCHLNCFCSGLPLRVIPYLFWDLGVDLTIKLSTLPFLIAFPTYQIYTYAFFEAYSPGSPLLYRLSFLQVDKPVDCTDKENASYDVSKSHRY